MHRHYQRQAKADLHIRDIFQRDLKSYQGQEPVPDIDKMRKFITIILSVIIFMATSTMVFAETLPYY